MTFYFSKGFRFGPFRVNASGAGLSVSFGLAGFRLGLNRWGVYFSISKHGFHYRTYLTGRRESLAADD